MSNSEASPGLNWAALAALAAGMVTLAASSPAVAAGYTAVGVQNDVDYNAVINGGWTVVYRGDYGTPFTLDSVFSAIAPGSNVMLAGIAAGSTSSFDVLAYATKAQVLQLTGLNQTHEANGANWYFNDSSMGFAGQGDSINQSSADIEGSGQLGMDPNVIERDRLSWHTLGNDDGKVDVVDGGWRSGSNVWLNDASSGWDRMVLTSPVPEPENYLMLLVGMGVLGFTRRRAR